MNRTVNCLLGTVALLALVTGCSSSSSGGGSPISEAKSSLARDTSPNVPIADQQALASGNNAFTFDVYKSLTTGSADNQFFSPYSISSALAMTYAGANGETATEMAKALHFTLPQAQLHPAFDQEDLTLASDNVVQSGQSGKPLTLHVANSLWGYTQENFGKPFLDTLAVNYGAGMKLVDFVKDTEGSRIAINGWVSDETDAKITNLIPQGSIDPSTRLVLVDAIYFDGNWATPFDAKSTQPAQFTKNDGSQVSVPTMSNDEVSALFAKTATYEAVELPYVGNVSMDIIMPTQGTMSAFEGTLTGSTFQTVVAGLKQGEGHVSLPKFGYHGDTISLKKLLQGLGMTTPFTGEADFSAIAVDPAGPLYIEDVLHKAFLSVDEQGTEAAAATAVIVGAGTAAPVDPPPSIDVNHSFFFALRDVPTNTILFAGRINDPSQQ